MRSRVLLGFVALLGGAIVGSVGFAGPAAADELVVNSTADTSDGSCDAAPGGCTLRDAFAVASGNGVADVIVLEPGATYALTDCAQGDLDHTDTADLTITGNGATIDQQCPDERVIEQAGAGVALGIDAVTLTGGAPPGTDDGGAVHALGPVTVTHSTIAGNSAESGAGLYVIDGSVFVSSSTISGNTAAEVGGGIFAGGEGAAITLRNSTVTGNRANEGGGVSTSGQAGEVTVTIQYATVVGNTALAGANIEGEGLASFASVVALGSGGGQDCFVSGPTVSDGWNVDGDGSCAFGAGPGDRSGVGDPGIGPLAANGGPTLTRLPTETSLLLDQVPEADCQDGGAVPVTVDQRGVTRPQNGACDVGAVEVETPVPVDLQPTFTG